MSSKSCLRFSKSYFKLEILIFLSFVVSFLVDMFGEKAPFLTKKISAVKSEAYFSREAIENKRGKVLKENSIIGRIWSSGKLFIMQIYADNANGSVPLTVENVIFLVSLSSRRAHVLLQRKTKPIDQSFSL